MFIAALFTKAKYRNTKYPSIYEWIKKIEYYLAIKKNKICNNKYGPRGYFAKCNKSDRERQIWYNFIYM